MQTPLAKKIRRIILEEAYRAGVGHIGSALSIADIMACLYGGILRGTGPNRDRLVLSKGHAALALYGALALTGRLKREKLGSYCGNGTLLGVHPDVALEGVDFTTGSLGMGLSYGVGAAIAAKLQGSARRTYVILSDGECNEGAVWEASMLAAQQRLDNLVAVLDLNGMQALGPTKEIIDMRDVAGKWEAFGWETKVADGHEGRDLKRAMTSHKKKGQPKMVVALTVLGKGVSFMENNFRWHYMPMSREEFERALEENKERPKRPKTRGCS